MKDEFKRSSQLKPGSAARYFVINIILNSIKTVYVLILSLLVMSITRTCPTTQDELYTYCILDIHEYYEEKILFSRTMQLQATTSLLTQLRGIFVFLCYLRSLVQAGVHCKRIPLHVYIHNNQIVEYFLAIHARVLFLNAQEMPEKFFACLYFIS